MGYWSRLEIVAVQINPDSVAEVEERLRQQNKTDSVLEHFLSCVRIDKDGWLEFKKDAVGYVQESEHGRPLDEAKWHGAEEIAARVSPS